MKDRSVHEHWSGRFAFLMAAIGSSVGLGNFWRFPYEAGQSGGGAFVIIYLLCAALVAFPILTAEYAIGRRAGMSAMESPEAIARESGRGTGWGTLGWVGGVAAFFILTFYCVVAGWVLIYIPATFMGTFNEMPADQVGAYFDDVVANPWRVGVAHLFFVALTAFIVGRGVKKGIETAVKILMPVFFLMLLILVVFAMTTGEAGQAVSFLFQPDFSQIDIETVASALSHSFFSIGVGAGLMITYGAYMDKKQSISQSAAIVAGSDTLIAVVAGLAIFPLVFQFGLDPAAGPGLFFVTLPTAFAQMPGGAIFGGLFFTLAFFAALTSSISLLEVAVSWFEERDGVSRWGAAIVLGFVMWIVGVGVIMSTTFLDVIDYVTGTLMLPLGGLLVAVFAGWVAKKQFLDDEIGGGFVPVWRVLIMFVAPLGVGVILVWNTIDSGGALIENFRDAVFPPAAVEASLVPEEN